jgi:hypothetical protein
VTLTDSQGIVALAIVVAVVVSIVLICAGDEPAPPDGDRVPKKPWKPNDERRRRLELLQAEAIEKMKALNIKSLLEGRPAWRKVNPMGKEAGELDLLVEEDNVVQMRRRG